MNSFLKKFFALSVVVLMTLVPLGVAFGTDVEDESILEAASITIDGVAVPIDLDELAVDLSDLADEAIVTGGSITVAEDATLVLNAIKNASGEDVMFDAEDTLLDELTARDLDELELSEGENVIPLTNYIDVLPLADDGVSMAFLRDLVGCYIVTLEGELNEEAVALTIQLAPPYKFGDVDGNGAIQVGDAILVLRHIVNLIELEGYALLAADVDGNGEIQVGDAILILRYIVNLVDSFPADADLAIIAASLSGDDDLVVDVDLVELEVDLTNVTENSNFTKASLNVNLASELELTAITDADGNCIMFDEEDKLIDVLGDKDLLVHELNKGNNDFEQDISIEFLIELLGDNAVFVGTITSVFGDSIDVSLTITLVNG